MVLSIDRIHFGKCMVWQFRMMILSIVDHLLSEILIVFVVSHNLSIGFYTFSPSCWSKYLILDIFEKYVLGDLIFYTFDQWRFGVLDLYLVDSKLHSIWENCVTLGPYTHDLKWFLAPFTYSLKQFWNMSIHTQYPPWHYFKEGLIQRIDEIMITNQQIRASRNAVVP